LQHVSYTQTKEVHYAYVYVEVSSYR